MMIIVSNPKKKTSLRGVFMAVLKGVAFAVALIIAIVAIALVLVL